MSTVIDACRACSENPPRSSAGRRKHNPLASNNLAFDKHVISERLGLPMHRLFARPARSYARSRASAAKPFHDFVIKEMILAIT